MLENFRANVLKLHTCVTTNVTADTNFWSLFTKEMWP